MLLRKIWASPRSKQDSESRYQKELRKEIDTYKLQIFSDYLQRLAGNREMLTYAERRWDLIHLFGSTMFALPIGGLVGFCAYLVLTRTQLGQISQIIANNASYIVPFALFITIVYICLAFGLKRAMSENSIARFIIIKELLQKKKKLPIELSDIFPEYFPPKEEPKNS